MDLWLTDQVAVVVGGGNGIGLAIARAFAIEGARVAVLDVDPRIESIAAGLGSKDPALGLRIDAADFEAMRSAARDIAVRWGRARHIVHAAAIGSGKFGFPFLNLEPSDWERVLAVNVLGAS